MPFASKNLPNPSRPPFTKGGVPLFDKEGSGEILRIFNTADDNCREYKT
jgi:hypothetical protein